MDPQSLTRLFATTYDSNPNTRKTGELAVRKVRVLRATGHLFVEWPWPCVLCRHNSILLSHHSLPAKKACSLPSCR